VSDYENVVATVVSLVAKEYDLEPEALLSSLREKGPSEARQVACLLLRKTTVMSYPELGRAMGGRDHTTIISAVKTAEKRIATDERAGRIYQRVLDIVTRPEFAEATVRLYARLGMVNAELARLAVERDRLEREIDRVERIAREAEAAE
jgi:hypothetical protein